MIQGHIIILISFKTRWKKLVQARASVRSRQVPPWLVEVADRLRGHHHHLDINQLDPEPSPGTTHANMHLRGIGLLTLGTGVVNAFVDTSPFILASTSEYVPPMLLLILVPADLRQTI